jgi:alkylation response protein AidB-like acyl-CoA dehydrogenase
MEFGLTEEQEMLKTSARDFLEKECTRNHVRAMMKDEIGYSPELWKKMAELGWLGLAFPSQYGGGDGTFRDLTILCEEMGRTLLPSPFISTVVLGSLPILFAGTDKQRQDFLPKIIAGEMTIALAVLEEDGDFWPSGINLRADKRGNEYLLNGTKLFVWDAKAADYLLCAARTKRGPNPEEGITLFLVDAKEWGMYMTPLDNVDVLRKQYEVVLTNVPVSVDNIIGELHNGWPVLKKMSLYANAALCAEMVGGCEKVLEMTVSYAKERIAYGVPIGSFQVIKHKCADMLSGNEYARSLMEWAALALSEDAPEAPVAVSMAKIYCGNVGKMVCDEGIQIHGGLGYTWDHDMHLYFKRVRASDTAFGDGNYHSELVAQYLEQI